MIKIKTLKNQKHDTGSAQGSLHSAKLHENTPEVHVTMRGEHKTMQGQCKNGSPIWGKGEVWNRKEAGVRT